jgi:predicted DNA-binding transcriptional regulator YafY
MEANTMDLNKYVGRQLEIIYVDRKEQITQRKVEVRSVQDGLLQAFDADKGELRSFSVDRVLAAMPSKLIH